MSGAAPGTARRSGLTRGQLVLLHVANAAVAGSGVVYAVLRYAVRPADPYAVVNHPLQPTFQHLHVVAAPLLVFALGVLASVHLPAAWARSGRPRAWSGAALAAAAFAMTLSGVLVQTATAPAWRTAWVATHLAGSTFWLLALPLHLAARRAGAAAETE